MQSLKFKTSIKCSGCVEAVKPHLNEAEGVKHWEVDLQSADKILTVQADQNREQEVVNALQKAGYQAEKL